MHFKKRNKLTYKVEILPLSFSKTEKKLQISVTSNSSYPADGLMNFKPEERVVLFDNEILLFNNEPVSMREIAIVISNALKDYMDSKIIIKNDIIYKNQVTFWGK